MDKKTCNTCKRTLAIEEFKGKKMCPDCIARIMNGKAKKAEAEKKQADAEKEADAAYLKKEPERKARPKRTPLVNRRVLDYNGSEEGFVYRNFVDKPGRLEEAEAAGWEYVRDNRSDALHDGGADRGKPLGSVATAPAGNGRTHYLMRKREDEFAEDMALTEARNLKIEEAILRPEQQNPSFYTKPGGIQIRTGLHHKQVKSI